MATLKQRLHRKNSAGTYDTIHYETSSDVVMRPSGRSVEQDLAAYLPEVQDNDNVPESLIHGKVISGTTKAFIGLDTTETLITSKDNPLIYDENGELPPFENLVTDADTLQGHKPSYFATANHTHSASNITSGILPVERGGTGVTSLDALKTNLGISSSVSDIISGNITLGNIIYMDNMEWRVVHIDYTAGEVILCKETIEETTKFGSSVVYSGSTIAALCNTFKNKLSSATKSKLITKYVHGVANTVWIPQSNWISASMPNSAAGTGASSWSGTSIFKYFISDLLRIALNASGAATDWWTASASSLFVWYVTTDGSLNGGGGSPSYTFGFRPFVALPL